MLPSSVSVSRVSNTSHCMVAGLSTEIERVAKVMADHPVRLRLKELESLNEIAGKIHEVRVVVGADGWTSLLRAGMLADERKARS